ncbi:MAG: COG4315 family predicted lipoprotein [Acidimicrobiia bacterium]
MMKRLCFLLAALILVVAACGGDDATDTTTGSTEPVAADTTTGPTEPAATEAPAGTTMAPTGEATVTVATGDLGDYLADGAGRALYLFTNDTQDSGASTCSGGCADNWPAYAGPATAGDGVDAALLGTIPGADGGEQVIYNGWPLYHFAGDSGSGETNGQGQGGVWFLVTPAGEAIS